MEFRENEAIYIQIAAYVSEQILLDTWELNAKIPSVRDLATDLQVNPNTVMRSYEFLQGKEVILNKRGIGFFVTEEAKEKIIADKRERFLGQELPEFFRNLQVLNIPMKEISNRFDQFKSENK